MKNKIKKYIASASFVLLSFGSFYPATQTLAQNQEPVLIEIKDTDIGTEAFEKLKEFGIGGHATLGAILGSGQNMITNPGVGLGIGSGGNGYRPTVIIAVWTNKPFDAAAGLQTIKQHLNVFANPVTTNGDCAIACDGTSQTASETSTVPSQTASETSTVPSQTASETSTATQTETSTQTTLPTAQPKSEPVVETILKTVDTTAATSTTVETVIVTTQVEKITSESEFVLKPAIKIVDVVAITAERIGDYNITPVL